MIHVNLVIMYSMKKITFMIDLKLLLNTSWYVKINMYNPISTDMII